MTVRFEAVLGVSIVAVLVVYVGVVSAQLAIIALG
jgi:hypothetical protein